MSYQRRSMRSKSFSQMMSSYTLPQGIRNPEALKRRGFSNLKILRRTRGFTLEGLSKLTGISPSYLSRLEAGARRLNTDLMKKLSPVLKCEPADLLGSTLAPLPSLTRKTDRRRLSLVSKAKDVLSAKGSVQPSNLPVYTLAAGAAEGTIEVNLDAPADWVVRPHQLYNIDKALALYVSDNSCLPRYQPGETLFLHPSKPLAVGCGVFVIDQNDTVHLYIFMGWEDMGLKVCSLKSPAAPVLLNKSDIKRSYKVIGLLCA